MVRLWASGVVCVELVSAMTPEERAAVGIPMVWRGYVDLEGNGHWWIPSGRFFFTTNPADSSASELAEAQADLRQAQARLDELTAGPREQEIARAGGIGREFNTIAVDDGIAMGHLGMLYSLPSRDLIADSIEYMVNAHCADPLIKA